MKKRNLKLALMTVIFASIISTTSSIIVNNQISEKQKTDTKITFSREEPSFVGVKGKNLENQNGGMLGYISIYTPEDSEYIPSSGELSLDWNKIATKIDLNAPNQYVNIVLPSNITSININSNMPYHDKIFCADFSKTTNLTHIEQFSNLPNLNWINLPDSVSTLGVGVFQNNSRLNKIFNLATTKISEIPANAFRGTGLKFIYLSDNITSIGGNAFADIPGFNIESANFPAKFNNAIDFAGMGIKKPSGDPFSQAEFGLKTIQNKMTFSDKKIYELTKNPYYPIELIKSFNKKALHERISFAGEFFVQSENDMLAFVRESTVRDVRAKFDAIKNQVYLEIIPNSLYAFTHNKRYLIPSPVTTITKFTTSIALDQEFASHKLPLEIFNSKVPSFINKIKKEVFYWNNYNPKDFTFSQDQILKELQLSATNAPETVTLQFKEVTKFFDSAYVFDIILKNATGAQVGTKVDIPITFSIKIKPDPQPNPEPDNNGGETTPPTPEPDPQPNPGPDIGGGETNPKPPVPDGGANPDQNILEEKTGFNVMKIATLGFIVGAVAILIFIIVIIIRSFKKKKT